MQKKKKKKKKKGMGLFAATFNRITIEELCW